jgi:1,4-dihydroxy-2-naphthoate octaprenyltransferase
MVGFKEVLISTRPWSFPMTIISITFGVVLSFYLDKIFDPILYVLTLIGSVSLHAAANVINDYYDAKFGVDKPGAPTTKYRPHPVVAGFLEPNDLLKMTFIFSLLSLLIAFYLSLVSGYLAFILGALGLVFALSYTSPPFNYKYKALGEVFVLLCWGPIMVLGAYYVQTSMVNIIPIVASLSIGLMVSAVLLANNIRDIEYDSSVNIKTIAIILGKDNALKLYGLMLISSYILILIMVLMGVLGLPTLLVFVTLPKAVNLVRSFMREVPDTADPQTAQLVMNFGILLIVGIILSIFI